MKMPIITRMQKENPADLLRPAGCNRHIQLSLNLGAILEGEHKPPIVEGRGFVHYRQPESLVKFSQFAISLRESEHETADVFGLRQPLILLLLECIQFSLRRVVSSLSLIHI